MKRFFPLLVFLSFFVFSAQSYPAESGVAYTDSERIHLFGFAPDRTQVIASPPNPATYSFFGKNKNKKKSFASKNFSVKMKSVKLSDPGGLSGSESLAIKTEFAPLKTLKILGEIKSDIPQDEDSEFGYSFRLGPSFKIKDFKIDAYYDKTGSLADYGDQGFFLNLDYRPLRWASVNINADKQWKSAADKDGADINHGLFQTSLSPFRFASIIAGIDINSDENGDSERLGYKYFARLDNRWGSYATFIDYQLEKLDLAGSYGGSDKNTLTAGVKKIWSKIEAWVKGGWAYHEARADENRRFAEFGLNYNPFSSVELRFENSYESTQAGNAQADFIKMSGEVDFSLPLPFGLKCQNSIKVDKTTEDVNYQFLTSVVISRF